MTVTSTKLLLTLAYSAQFSYPLKLTEWFIRCVGRTSREEFSQQTEFLVKGGFVNYVGDKVFIPGKEKDIALREEREQSSQTKRFELQPLLHLLTLIPWIEGVAITGSAAVNNAGEQDDIDLLIVTAQNRLWLVRPLVIFFAFLKGKRRSWASEEKNSWCFNLWLERSTLQQPARTHSLYVAYEVCQADWLIDKNNTRWAFLNANKWVRTYLPQYYSYRLRQPAQLEQAAEQLAWPIVDEVITICNLFSYWAQRIYMARHMTRERVALHMAFFHPRDTQRVISHGLHAIVAAWLNK